MVIQSDLLPFSVTFTMRFLEGESEQKVPFFFTTESELYEEGATPVISVTENIPLQIHFQSDNSSDRLYMDGLDALPETFIQIDKQDGDIFLQPSEHPVVLYDIQAEYYYPYIPGLYRLKVRHENENYYAWLKIVPKQINQKQLDIMREEVEQVLKGLAHDLVYTSAGLDLEQTNFASPELFKQFRVIQANFKRTMSALNDLYRKVNYRIKKVYQLVPEDKSRLIDQITIRHRTQHPETKQLIKTPVNTLDFDLPENRLVKSIVEKLIQTLSLFASAVETYVNKGNTEIPSFEHEPVEKKYHVKNLDQLKEYMNQAQQMRGALHWFRTAPWYKQVSEKKDLVPPIVMTTDVRYRTLYQLMNNLRRESVDIQLDRSLAWQWKRTDKLYEIWGFIQLLKFLQDERLGFTPVSGWLYNEEIHDHLIIPSIQPGTTVSFSKGDLFVKIVYEGKLPTQSLDTHPLQQPLYTSGTNNHPDGRLDVYEKEMYLGSLLFDFKYRSKTAIWKPDLISTNKQTNTMKQLVSYAFHCRSPHLFEGKLDKSVRNTIRPVPEVWAIYPGRKQLQTSEYHDDHGIKLIELSPGFENSHIIDELKQIIDLMLQRKEAMVR
jgi:hypothetical protein